MGPVRLLLLAAVLAGCGRSNEPRCRGLALATFTFQAALPDPTLLSDPGLACGFDPSSAPLSPFTATVAVDPGGGTAAWLCTGRPLAEPLEGTLVGDALDVSLSNTGAVLTQCADGCAVGASERVTGTLLRGPDGTPMGFTGRLLETFTAVSAAACGACGAGCDVAYPLVAP